MRTLAEGGSTDEFRNSEASADGDNPIVGQGGTETDRDLTCELGPPMRRSP